MKKLSKALLTISLTSSLLSVADNQGGGDHRSELLSTLLEMPSENKEKNQVFYVDFSKDLEKTPFGRGTRIIPDNMGELL